MSEPDQRLKADEDSVNGDWIYRDGQMVGDANCRRIEWLILHHLRKVGDSIKAGAWETLYRDPDDGRYWEKTFPRSEMHGGGPPKLRTITSDEIKDKYGLV
jgi:Immunity protein 27